MPTRDTFQPGPLSEPSSPAEPFRRFRVLVVTNMWPSDEDPSYGSFVRDQMESLRPLGVNYAVLFINGRRSQLNYARSVWELRRMLHRGAYDLVHAHFGLSGCVARLQRSIPLVVTFHGDDVLGRPKRNGRITAVGRMFQLSSFWLARRAAAVIVPSAEMKAKLRLGSVEIIPCGVDLNLFQPMPQSKAREALGLSSAKKYVLFPYNPSEQRKRFDLVEKAVQQASESVSGLEILCVRGRPHTEMPLYMNAADALVMASLIEGSPVALKEAMACNLPVVTVNVGDAAELVRGAASCRVVERDARAIAAGITEVLRTGARAGGRDAVRNSSMENTARRILKVYARVLGRTGPESQANEPSLPDATRLQGTVPRAHVPPGHTEEGL